jgi:hypothetical protein
MLYVCVCVVCVCVCVCVWGYFLSFIVVFSFQNNGLSQNLAMKSVAKSFWDAKTDHVVTETFQNVCID